ncbi:hypothetical protein LX36DRAFT_54675 [Colletotrichum falcatum]|nr:hypothetical protein LX36DRAFT_54675 [Colletotrichum falcatum]
MVTFLFLVGAGDGSVLATNPSSSSSSSWRARARVPALVIGSADHQVNWRVCHPIFFSFWKLNSESCLKEPFAAGHWQSVYSRRREAKPPVASMALKASPMSRSGGGPSPNAGA